MADNNNFLDYILKYSNKMNGWVDVKLLIKKVIESFALFINSTDKYTNVNYEIEFINERCLNVVSMFEVISDIQEKGFSHKYKIDSKYYSPEYGLNIKEIISLPRSNLDNLIKTLELYLKIVTIDQNITPIPKIASINPDYVITFNYTDIYKKYEIDEEHVFYVHGKLDAVHNNMVLGFNDEYPEVLDFIYFKKYYQVMQKNLEFIDESKFKTIYGNPDDSENVIHFYGHSLDNTDGDLIRFLRTCAIKFVIYYYNDKDFEEKIVNLIAVFGKKFFNIEKIEYFNFQSC